MSEAAQTDLQLVRNHLTQNLGRPTNVFEVRGSTQPGSVLERIQIAHFSPKGPEGPGVFTTCGASSFVMADGRRIEGVMMLNPKPPKEAFGPIHRILTSLALLPEAKGQPVKYGEIVRAGDLLASFCKMAAVIFMPPLTFPKAFHQTTLSDGGLVEMVWVLPVYESEAVVVLKHGPDMLMKLFAKERVDPLLTQRRPAIAIPGSKDAEVKSAPPEKPNSRPPPPSPKRGATGGSFEVAEEDDMVKIVRRGTRGRKEGPLRIPRMDRFAPPPPEPPEPEEETVTQRPRPARRVGGPRPSEEDEVIRFDLSARKSEGAARKTPDTKKKEAPPAPKRVMASAEEKAAEKKKRIEDLKAKAAEAAKRAAARAERTVADTAPGSPANGEEDER